MIEKLQRIGLSKKESEIYLALAKKEMMTANNVAKETSSNRTVCYNILQQLVEKGLITYITKNNKRLFSITNPKSLLAEIKEKEDVAKELVKDLNLINQNKLTKQSVEVFEGKKGLRKIFEEIRNCRELYVINATGLVFENLPFSAKHIMKDLEKSSKVKVIATQSMKETELIKMKKAKIKYLPKKAENFATTFIFNGKIIIQTLKNKPFLIKIKEESIYDGYKKDFEVLWDKL